MEPTINWSPRPVRLQDLPENAHTRLRQLEPNRPICIEIVGGGKMFVRRVGINKFQYGVAEFAEQVKPEAPRATAGD